MAVSLWILMHLLSSSHSMPPKLPKAYARCHTNGGPIDTSSRCDSSSQQIVYCSNQAKQKRNLIIFDIDLTILEAIPGFHDALPAALQNNAAKFHFTPLYNKVLDLNLLLIVCVDISDGEQSRYSIVFRKHFFDLLKYIHFDQAYSADLVLYTRGSPRYARKITLGITECYKAKYPNHNISDSSVNIYVCTLTCHSANEIFQKHRLYSKW